MRRFYILALLIFATMTAFSQEGKGLNLAEIDKQVIPEDTAVRKGVLSNGLTYYVCRNDKPAKQAFFYLLVKAGSVVEQDNERGIAHFVEHMLFKGTKHFPGSVINFFRRNGLQFGHDTNAFTGFSTVRYQLNAIPVDNTLLMDSCLLLLRDWAGDAIIDAKDVESEHNVVVEEWRVRNTVSYAQQLLNDLFNHSIYADRFPIGDMDIVKDVWRPQAGRVGFTPAASHSRQRDAQYPFVCRQAAALWFHCVDDESDRGPDNTEEHGRRHEDHHPSR